MMTYQEQVILEKILEPCVAVIHITIDGPSVLLYFLGL